MELAQKQLNYYEKWGNKRKNKLKYLLINGMLYFALPFSIFQILFELNDHHFVFSMLTDFVLIFLISSVIGILSTLYKFKVIDKKYLELKNKSLI